MPLTWKESDMVFACQALRSNPKLTLRDVSRVYDVPRTTLFNRYHG
jgi:hypothetical protein